MTPESHREPDEYQQAWQVQSSQARVTVDAKLLLEEVNRSQRDFRAMIRLRDVREVGVALVMLPVWFYMGYTLSLPWSWYLKRAGLDLGRRVHSGGPKTPSAEAG